MSTDIQKQAQLFTKLKEKTFSTGRRKFKASPVRWTGKALLKKRSPEVYKRAIEAVDKVDRLIREVVSRQNILVAQLNKYKKGLALPLFSSTAQKFVREQKLINAAVTKLSVIFNQIADEKGVSQGATEEAKLNLAINMDVGKKPGLFQKEPEELEDESAYLDSQLGKISEAYYGLCKQALFGGSYWRTRTQSGREFAKKFDRIYDYFKLILDKNVATLERLDELQDIGDPAEYLKVAKKLSNITEILAKPEVANAWEMFAKALEPPKAPKEKSTFSAGAPPPEMIPEAKTEVVEPKKDIEYKKELLPIPPVAPPEKQITTMIPPPFSKGKTPSTIPPAKPASVPPPPPPELKEEEQREKPKKPSKLEKQLGVKPAEIHFKFIKKLAKKVEAGANEKEIAAYMLKYANQIDEIDSEYALELTAIAEGIINE